jgi:probable DNA metabolism protein
MHYFEFDGSFEGLLCAVFQCFEKKQFQSSLIRKGQGHHTLFDRIEEIQLQKVQAKRVWQQLIHLIGKAQALQFYRVILAEDPLADEAAYTLMVRLFKSQKNALSNYGDKHALYFAQTLKKINRERHRMTAFVRFQKSLDGLYVAQIAPDFNVLPLIKEFFKKRYADQPWLIYDTKRAYGIWYDLQQVLPISLAQNANIKSQELALPAAYDDQEMKYQKLWQDYYQSTNIQERFNPKLFIKHVPKRYWSQMTELSFNPA